MGNARAREIPAQLVEDEDYQLRHERVAGIDIAKAKADVCTRLPPARDGGRRASRLEEVPATAREILALAGRLLADGVELAVMEATSDYWRIWYYLLGAPRGWLCQSQVGSGPNFGLWGNLWGPVTYCDHCWSADSPVLVSRG